MYSSKWTNLIGNALTRTKRDPEFEEIFVIIVIKDKRLKHPFLYKKSIKNV